MPFSLKWKLSLVTAQVLAPASRRMVTIAMTIFPEVENLFSDCIDACSRSEKDGDHSNDPPGF